MDLLLKTLNSTFTSYSVEFSYDFVTQILNLEIFANLSEILKSIVTRNMKRKQSEDEDFRNFKLSKEEEAFEKGLITQEEYYKYLKKKLGKILPI